MCLPRFQSTATLLPGIDNDRQYNSIIEAEGDESVKTGLDLQIYVLRRVSH